MTRDRVRGVVVLCRQKKVGAVHPNGPRAIEVNRPYLCSGRLAAGRVRPAGRRACEAEATRRLVACRILNVAADTAASTAVVARVSRAKSHTKVIGSPRRDDGSNTRRRRRYQAAKPSGSRGTNALRSRRGDRSTSAPRIKKCCSTARSRLFAVRVRSVQLERSPSGFLHPALPTAR